MNATHPEKRFNESFLADGKSTVQPAWDNFNTAWEDLLHSVWYREKPPVRQSFDYIRVNNLVSGIIDAQHRMLLNNVDGTQHGAVAGARSRIKLWNRNQYVTHFSRAEAIAFEWDRNRSELSRFFNIVEDSGGNLELRFKSIPELASTLPEATGNIHAESSPEDLFRYILEQVYRQEDPIERAAEILYWVPKLHPGENGNGRLARLWAGIELAQAGLPMPVGLPTNDFLMNRSRMKLEVRKALAIGKHWQKMLGDAHARGIKPDDFFQKVFKGSALEGLMHLDPSSEGELHLYVNWLERHLMADEAWRAIGGVSLLTP